MVPLLFVTVGAMAPWPPLYVHLLVGHKISFEPNFNRAKQEKMVLSQGKIIGAPFAFLSIKFGYQLLVSKVCKWSVRHRLV